MNGIGTDYRTALGCTLQPWVATLASDSDGAVGVDAFSDLVPVSAQTCRAELLTLLPSDSTKYSLFGTAEPWVTEDGARWKAPNGSDSVGMGYWKICVAGPPLAAAISPFFDIA